jgi:heavy metal efflux system protein
VIDRLVAFALEQQFITLALAVVLTAAGIASYHRLPIEAYPDVGDVRVEVITLWPGHAAEDRRSSRTSKIPSSTTRSS